MNAVSHHAVSAFGLTLVVCGSLWAKHALDVRFQMALTHAHFTEAVQVSRNNMLAERRIETGARFTDTGVPTLGGQPSSTGEWIALFNERARHAPEGGAAFIVNSDGNPATGAIGVGATNYGKEVQISRPSYRSLKKHKVIISRAGIHQSASNRIKS